MTSILVDTREPNELTMLALRHPDFKAAALPSGDFSFTTYGGRRVGIERKTASGVLTDMASSRLMDQVGRMVEDYDLPYLMVEGTMYASHDGKLMAGGSPALYTLGSWIGFLATLQEVGIRWFNTASVTSTLNTVWLLAEHWGKSDHASLYRRRRLLRAPKRTPGLMGMHLAMGVDGIEFGRAKALLQHASTFRRLAAETANPRVKGIGPDSWSHLQTALDDPFDAGTLSAWEV